MVENSNNITLEQRIDAYIKGNLTKEQTDELWAELLKQPEYIAYLQTEIDLTRLYKAKKHEAKKGGYWKWIGMAAAIVLLVVSINFFGGYSQKSIQQWSLHKINEQDNLSTAQVTRSASHISTPDSMLNAGFKAVMQGNAKGAMEIYKKIISRYNDADIISKAYLNLGILQYNAGNFSKSIDNFKHAVAHASGKKLLKERAYWYLGNAYINVKDLPSAREDVLKAYHIGKIYKMDEYKLLKRLDYKLGNIEDDDIKPQSNSG